jgi:hypothetical protein
MGRYETLIRARFGTIPETLTTAQLADAMGVAQETIQRWRMRGTPYTKTYKRGKGTCHYKTADVIEWATMHQPLPVAKVTTRAAPAAEWGWQLDQKINCVTDKTA